MISLLQTADAVVVAEQTRMGLWQLFMSGGWLMWVLLILGGLTIFIFVERFMAIRKASEFDMNFMNRIRDYILDGKVAAAVDLCRKTNTTIAGGAPMIGFLGTVVGMVQTFMDMAAAGGTVDMSLLSSGMYVAMITTVGGLLVGIPAYFGYNYLVARIEKLVFRMEANSIAFMDILNQPVQK